MANLVFIGWVVLSQVLALTTLVLVGVWMGHFQGGFAWTEDPSREFNYHVLFLVIGLVFLYGEAILVYRVFPNSKKLYIKVLHTALCVLSLIFVGVGLKAVFDSHNLVDPPLPNMFSLHSWMGIVAVGLFSAQWLVGLLTFLLQLPIVPMSFRRRYKPVHVYWGLLILVLSVASCLTGMSEKAIFSVKDFGELPPEGILLNTLGLVLVALAAVLVYIVVNPAFARPPPLPEKTEERQMEEK